MDAFVAAVLSALVSGALTLFSGYYLWVLQRERAELSYQILTAAVIIPKLPRPSPHIQITVRESLIDDAGSDDLFVPVDEIVGFRVSIRNSGTTVVQDQRITFTLSEESKVLSIEPEEVPDRGEAAIETTIEQKGSNVASVLVPFINPGEMMVFSLQSIGDKKTRCLVGAAAPGLRLSKWRRKFQMRVLVAVTGFVVVSVSPAVVLKLLEISGEISEYYTGAITGYLVISSLAGVMALFLAASQLLDEDKDSPRDSR